MVTNKPGCFFPLVCLFFFVVVFSKRKLFMYNYMYKYIDIFGLLKDYSPSIDISLHGTCYLVSSLLRGAFVKITFYTKGIKVKITWSYSYREIETGFNLVGRSWGHGRENWAWNVHWDSIKVLDTGTAPVCFVEHLQLLCRISLQ